MKTCKVCGEPFEPVGSPRPRGLEICDPCRAKVDPTHLIANDPIRRKNLKMKREAQQARQKMHRIAQMSSA